LTGFTGFVWLTVAPERSLLLREVSERTELERTGATFPGVSLVLILDSCAVLAPVPVFCF
jgi:hypothetical protein